ncbi:ABC transporter substrate-binding protein [Azospirillum sp. A26]|uniref:ABC transporter substrate-binding protein n=1 Tax=Azospirillum sp. A26 TaxID=3160607 RepID=UPI00366C521F
MKGSVRLALAVGGMITLAAGTGRAADEVVRLGLSVPLSGTAAVWGKAADWLCKRAAQDVAAAGGVKVAGKTYAFECISYDNKYNAADGAKVAQTLLNRDGVRFIALSIGTAPVRALQSLSERNGALLFTVAWGASIKGPNFPLTFTQMNTPYELFGPLLGYVKNENPGIRTVALLNPNDATGQDSEPVNRKVWESLGVKVVSSDWYERGTTEFQPIAAKIAGMKPDAVDLGTSPPGESGSILRELKVLGWDGVKVEGTGSGTDGIVQTGGEAANGVYVGAAIPFDGPFATDRQKAINEEARAAFGENLNAIEIGAYNAVMALKAGMEKAQSVDPRKVAAALPEVVFDSFYGPAAYGGKADYGSAQQMLIPVIVSQIQGGKLVERQRILPDELKARIGQ